MQLVTTFALAIALATTAAASDLLLYLDFEQTPPQDPHYLASDPSAAFSFQPLELNALERALRGADAEPDEKGLL